MAGTRDREVLDETCVSGVEDLGGATHQAEDCEAGPVVSVCGLFQRMCFVRKGTGACSWGGVATRVKKVSKVPRTTPAMLCGGTAVVGGGQNTLGKVQQVVHYNMEGS